MNWAGWEVVPISHGLRTVLDFSKNHGQWTVALWALSRWTPNKKEEQLGPYQITRPGHLLDPSIPPLGLIYSIHFKINTILEPGTLNIENSESEFWRIHATLHQTISVINLLNGPVVFSGKGTYRVVC